MTEQQREPFQMFLRNSRGTTIRATNPIEAQRLQDEAGYKPVSAEEGEAAFTQKRKVAEKLGIGQE